MEIELAHYGVKGMRWGVNTKAKRTDAERTRYTKAPNKLTEAELKRRINRMETEKRYRELNEKTVGTGKKLATEILTAAGKQTVQTTVAAVSLYAVKKAFDAKFGEGTSKEIFTKKGK